MTAAIALAPAPDVHARQRRMLLALLPLLLVRLAGEGTAFGLPLLLALAWAGLGFATSIRARAHPARPDLSMLLDAVLLVAWLPPNSGTAALLASLGTTTLAARLARDDLHRPLFHPAMAGIAAAWWLFPAAFDATSFGPLAVVAATAGTLAVLALRLAHWRAPLALLGVAGLAQAAVVWISLPYPPPSLAGVHWVLAAGFVVGGATGCVTPRGRLGFGAGTGLLALAASATAVPAPAALACSALVMNALAPWLDACVEPACWRREGAA